jgi:hypothetical protein
VVLYSVVDIFCVVFLPLIKEISSEETSSLICSELGTSTMVSQDSTKTALSCHNDGLGDKGRFLKKRNPAEQPSGAQVRVTGSIKSHIAHCAYQKMG